MIAHPPADFVVQSPRSGAREVAENRGPGISGPSRGYPVQSPRSGARDLRGDLAARIEGADPRAHGYLVLRWRDCWPTLTLFDAYPPELWSAAICRWAEGELDRIEALLVRIDQRMAA